MRASRFNTPSALLPLLHNVQRSKHYGVLAVRQCDDHGMCDDRAVLGMFHTKDLARARVNLEWHKRDGPKETANLF